MSNQFKTQWGGRDLIIEVGKYAGQANGSCTVRYGDTVVLATATMAETLREGIGFFPLMVDYEEKLYAAGKIKTSRFIKREGRPPDDAILVSRKIDRAIRPLFDDRMRNDVQVITTVLSADLENSADVPAFVAASAALAISNIPWNGPIGTVRVGLIPPETEEPTSKESPGEWVVNPTFAAREKSLIDLIVCGTEDKIIMIEAGAKQVSEEVMEQAIQFGKKHLNEALKLIKEIQEKTGKAKRSILEPDTDPLLEDAKQFIVPKIQERFFSTPKASKEERRETRRELETELDAYLTEKDIEPEKRALAVAAVYDIIETEVSRMILDEDKRVDGRALDAVRPLICETGILPRTHGSGHFSRGETQVVSTVTLGSPSLEQIVEGMEVTFKKRFMHHYNFPPYSVGEVKPMRGPGRRDIGHGALAEKALEPVVPSKEDFPYTIRVVSEVLASNGSSSMASTCGATLALMDAGVPITAPVTGVAMGLASDKSGRWKILTDIQDLEDGKGGMDFKVTGTEEGITAIQLDTKTDGLTDEIIKETLVGARKARLEILKSMKEAIGEPRAELSQYAPRIYTLQIKPEKIRDVIGPGGKIINEIIDKTGVEIDIEQTGLVIITSLSAEAAEKALEWVKNLTREVVAGESFQGKITRLMDFGAFAEVLPNQEGLIHISELAPFHVDKVEDVVKVGDVVPVKVIEIDDMGRINLSLKQAPDYSVEKYGKGLEGKASSRPPRQPGGFGSGRGPGRGRDSGRGRDFGGGRGRPRSDRPPRRPQRR